jgi:hypothetical protein
VGKHREEFVFDAARLLEIPNQLRALLRQRAFVLHEQPACSDVHHGAGCVARRAAFEHDPSTILQPPDFTIVADNPVLDAVFGVRRDRIVNRLHHARVVVGVDTRECRIANGAFGFGRVEARECGSGSHRAWRYLFADRRARCPCLPPRVRF